jgi:hypothetical protein
MAQVLEKEAETYERHREELLAKHEGKYVLIYGEQVQGIFDTPMDAVRSGYQRFGHVPIFVKEIERVETPVTFGGGLRGPSL